MKQFLLTFLLLIIPFACFSQEWNWTDPETGIAYRITVTDEANKYASLYNYSLPTPAPQVVKIPDTYNGYKITEANVNFYGNNGVKKVILPKYLKRIEDYSTFHGAFDIEEIVWNSELEWIGQEICDQTSKLREVDLSNTKVTYIGFMAFWQNTYAQTPQLSSFKLSPCIQELDDGIWTSVPLKTLTLPASLEKITQYTFQRMGELEELIFESPTPATIVKGHSMYSGTPTGDQLFDDCPKLKVVQVPVESSVDYKAAMCFEKTKELYHEKLVIGPAGYTTYYLENENFLVPTGCTAYIITGVTPSGTAAPDQAIVKAFGAGKIIPKQTGFILQGPANSTVLYQAAVSGIEEDVTGNLLVGTATEREISGAGYKYYVLSNSGDQGLGFYKQGTRGGASIKLKAHRAGLRLTESIARAKSFIIDFDAARENANVAGIRNIGQEAEGRDNVIYDLQGRRVKNPTHGIYIINGKKVIK